MHVGAANIAWTHDIWDDALRMHKKQYSLNRILTRLRESHPGFRISRSQLHANLKAFALEGPSYKPYSLHTKADHRRAKVGRSGSTSGSTVDPFQWTRGSRPTVFYVPFDSEQLANLSRHCLSPPACRHPDDHPRSLEDAAVLGLVSLRGGSEPSSSQGSASEYSGSESGDSQVTVLTRDSTPRQSPVLLSRTVQVTNSQHTQEQQQLHRGFRGETGTQCTRPKSSSPSHGVHPDETSFNALPTCRDGDVAGGALKRECSPLSSPLPLLSTPFESKSCAGIPSRCSCGSMSVQEVGGSLLWKAVLAGDVSASRFLLRNGADLNLEQPIGAVAAAATSSSSSSTCSASSSSSSSSPSAKSESIREMIDHALRQAPERKPEIMACLHAVREFQGGCPVQQSC